MDGTRFCEVRGYQPGRTEWFDPRTNGYTLFAGTLGSSGEDPADARKPAARQVRLGRKPKARAGEESKIAPSTKLWTSSIPLTGKAITLAGNVLFVAGTPSFSRTTTWRKPTRAEWAASASTGDKRAQYKLDAPPAWDGLAAAGGILFLSLADGRVMCMGPQRGRSDTLSVHGTA